MPNAALTGITSGQFDFPDGLSFGGTDLSWSGRTLFAIAQKHLILAKRILHIDWHIGIGKYGQAHFILDGSRTSKAFSLLSKWFPNDAIHCDDVVDGVSIVITSYSIHYTKLYEAARQPETTAGFP